MSEIGAEQREIPRNNYLEGSILTHGFKGNIGHADMKRVLKAGAIISPSLRAEDHDEREKKRWEWEAKMDAGRVCLRAQTEEDTKSDYYISECVFVMPLCGLEGLGVCDDRLAGLDSQAISVRDPKNENGVSIPFSKGVMVLTLETFSGYLSEITEMAKRCGDETPEEWIKKHFHITDRQTFEDGTRFWDCLTNLCKPAENVKIVPHIATEDEVTSGLYGMNVGEIATSENLGQSGIKEFETVGEESVNDLLAGLYELKGLFARTIKEIVEDRNYENYRLLTELYKRTSTGEDLEVLEEQRRLIEIVRVFGPEGVADPMSQLLDDCSQNRTWFENWLEEEYGDTAPTVDLSEEPLFTKDFVVIKKCLKLSEKRYIWRDPKTKTLMIEKGQVSDAF